MRKKIVAGAVCATLLAGSTLVLAQDVPPIESNSPFALDRPEIWDCSRIYPEYRAYLDSGNDPDNWKYAGKFYRDTKTGSIYSWEDWIDWSNTSGCGGETALVKPEAGPLTGTLIGLFITGSGAGLIAAENGSGPMSPG